MDELQRIMTRYANFAMTGDGISEINSLSYLPWESEYPAPDVAGRLALVLIEPRLLEAAGDGTLRPALIQCLRRLKGDLRAEGLQSRLLLANVYRGSVHKDGRTVLALRRFLRDVKATYRRLEGAILVGSFPEATLFRRVAWAPGFLNPRRLAVWTELISERSDLVLSDLNGNWESLYRQEDFDAEDINATPDVATTRNGWFDGERVRNCEFTSSDFTVTRSRALRDGFYMDDSIYSILEHTTSPPRLRLTLRKAERNNEVHADERTTVNVLAKPEISVSRINARAIAVNPNPAIVGDDGQRLLDAAGNPQPVTSAASLFDVRSQQTTLFTHHDFDLERRLLISYFDRNHRFRIGAFAHLPFRGGALAASEFTPDRYEPLVNAAANDFDNCVKVEGATLLDYVRFLKTPAVLKYLMAHSSASGSGFGAEYDAAALASEVGGPPFRWVRTGNQYIPSLEGLGGTADLFLHRALWHHATLERTGASLLIHGGCNVNSVMETQVESYGEEGYGHWNNAEGLLFFTNAVALLARAKGFNDSPNGFCDGYRLSDRANFGSCYRSYFNAQSNDGGLSNIQRKRAYFWSMIGDWTLRLRNQNGLGLLALRDSLGSVDVHPNRAWIDGWNYDASTTRVRGIGDVDGDGRDEMVVSSDWGIGILKYDGVHFRCLMAAPRDTWFGGWRYDATVNAGRDKVRAVDDFTGSGRSEILLVSTWGLTTLGYSGSTLLPTRVYSNGTRLGGWVMSTADDRYWGNGRFDVDRHADIVITSQWGLGIISLERESHVFMARNGTRLGGWLFDSADTRIRLIADLDGDGLSEILVSGSWGIGVLKMVDGQLRSVAMHENGARIDGHVVRSTNAFALADNLRGRPRKQVVVTDPLGLHVFELDGERLARVAFVEHEQRVNGWVIDTRLNRFQAAGDLNGDGRAEMLVRSPWGIGVLGLDASDRVRCHTLAPYDSVLGDWHLQADDAIVGVGNLNGAAHKEILVVKS